MENCKRIFGPASVNENNMLMGKDDSQFTAPNHIHTGQDESMSTNSHKDASFIKFREHAFEVVRKSSSPIPDTLLYIPILYWFIKTITLHVRCQQRLDREGQAKSYLTGSTWHLNLINSINREEVIAFEGLCAG